MQLQGLQQHNKRLSQQINMRDSQIRNLRLQIQNLLKTTPQKSPCAAKPTCAGCEQKQSQIQGLLKAINQLKQNRETNRNQNQIQINLQVRADENNLNVNQHEDVGEIEDVDDGHKNGDLLVGQDQHEGDALERNIEVHELKRPQYGGHCVDHNVEYFNINESQDKAEDQNKLNITDKSQLKEDNIILNDKVKFLQKRLQAVQDAKRVLRSQILSQIDPKKQHNTQSACTPTQKPLIIQQGHQPHHQPNLNFIQFPIHTLPPITMASPIAHASLNHIQIPTEVQYIPQPQMLPHPATIIKHANFKYVTTQKEEERRIEGVGYHEQSHKLASYVSPLSVLNQQIQNKNNSYKHHHHHQYQHQHQHRNQNQYQHRHQHQHQHQHPPGTKSPRGTSQSHSHFMSPPPPPQFNKYTIEPLSPINSQPAGLPTPLFTSPSFSIPSQAYGYRKEIQQERWKNLQYKIKMLESENGALRNRILYTNI